MLKLDKDPRTTGVQTDDGEPAIIVYVVSKPTERAKPLLVVYGNPGMEYSQWVSWEGAYWDRNSNSRNIVNKPNPSCCGELPRDKT